MKKLFIFTIALMCSRSIFSTSYLVELGTTDAASWTEAAVSATGGTVVKLTTENKSLNEWFNAKINETAFAQGDTVWIAAGTYVLNGTISMQRTTDYSNNKSYSVYGIYVYTKQQKGNSVKR
jgi:hypothetical protein